MVPVAVPASTSVVRVGSQVTPEEAWILAPLIAGQPTYRLGRWIGERFQYPRPATTPKITAALPSRPAAVLVHGVDGFVSTLCLDLDTSKALKHVVDQDADSLGRLLTECGLRWVEDFSPSGGRHLYIPLAERMDGAAARELVEALGFLAPSLDPGPHQNVTDGCIRVPGSKHKRGGHQTLVTPLSEAYDIMRRPNGTAAIDHLRSRLAPEVRRNRELKARRATVGTMPAVFPTSLPGSELPLRRTARTGLYDTARYKSPSEARLAVLNHLAACSWTLQQIRMELPGQLAGLAALYGTDAKRDRLLETEWAKAVTYAENLKNPGTTKRRLKDPLINDTSQTVTTGGALQPLSRAAVHSLVNDLENVLYAVLDHRLKSLGRESHSLRILFRALLGYLRTMETDLLDVGCRTLATALGKHHATVARLLPRLAALSDGILSKVFEARGRAADTYLVQLPENYQQLARELTWRKGKIYGLRPVFRVLGDPAALVYEHIERARTSPTTAEIIRATGIKETAVSKALGDMASLGMIHRDGRPWKITSVVNLTELAIRLGATDDVAAQIALHRKQRGEWHAYLDRHNGQEQINEADLFDAERDEYWMPPPDEAPERYYRHLMDVA
ncbi:hypothetical protein ACSBOX_21480 (plasmid) [Arthrobacter sp. KN11-1C]|uniref:hypothetical protein n=1 Tax=Arthrobacter sp. KN11-1C TaxID=3445774 RepID=UPI003FA02303